MSKPNLDRFLLDIDVNGDIAPPNPRPAQTQTQLSSFDRLTQFYNDNHDEKGRFAPAEGSKDSGDLNIKTPPTPTHIDKQIKEAKDMIKMIKDQVKETGTDEAKKAGANILDALNKNLAALQGKKASGVTPYHGADLYVDPRLMDYDREQHIEAIKETLDIVAKVHEPSPTLEPVKIWEDDSLKGGVLGVYKPAFNQIGVQDIHDSFSMVHELGHWQTLNPNFDMEARTNPEKHFLDNVNKLGLGNIYYNITQSDAIKKIDTRARAIDVRNPSDSDWNKIAYAQYLNTSPERYARAYAQYIAIRANDPKLKAQMESFRSNNRTDNVQWTDEDFAPIAKAFDEHFQGQGKVKAANNANTFEKLRTIT